MTIVLDQTYLKGHVAQEDIEEIIPQIAEAHDALSNRTGKGGEFTGWLDLPEKTKETDLETMIDLGEEVRSESDCLVSIGIGGSYIGIRASLEFLSNDQKFPVYFAGHNLSAGYLNGLLEKIRDQRVTVVVISKSGTTTEPALAFRIVREFMEKKYSREDLKKRIICITDERKGALRRIANEEGYRTFVIRDDIGGRFSVLTPVGLVPLAVAGLDIRAMIEGARAAQRHCSVKDVFKNMSYQYAVARYLLYKKGRVIEVLSAFHQRMSFLEEWWKQLFGESEGKDGKGIFPASLNFTADLHSMGQLLQEGERNIFETFLIAEDCGHSLVVPVSRGDQDNFNCVADKELDYVNKQAYKATAMAHFEGDIPNMTIKIPVFDANTLGQLYYFFEKAVAMTGYLMGVNPFDQPGVEAYKRKMFQLLGRE